MSRSILPAILVAVLLLSPARAQEKVYKTPEEAVQALAAAARKVDVKAFTAVLTQPMQKMFALMDEEVKLQRMFNAALEEKFGKDPEHHALDDPRGAVIETWRSSHTRFHQTIGREPNPWRQQHPEWAEAWQREQSACWRCQVGSLQPNAYRPLATSGRPMMATRNRKMWFFVSHLQERDRPSSGMPYEIQLLNAQGQAIACGYADDETDSLQIQGQLIPLSVIEAARRQPIGKGDDVDEAGNSLPPF